MPESPPDPAPAPAAPLSTPVPGVRVYRAALGDVRGKLILAAFGSWLLLQISLAAFGSLVDTYLPLLGMPRPTPPDAPLWFSWLDLQIGVRAFESLHPSFFTSAAWQAAGLLLMLAALVVVLTQRLRIIALVLPVVLFSAAALFQCLAYNAYHSYWAQGNPLFTLGLMIASLGVTLQLAPRNSGWAELRSIIREFLRQTARTPAAQLFGPIFAMEVRVVGRRRATYWLRFLYPLGLLALITLIYTTTITDIERFSSGAERIQRLQEIAPTLAIFISWAQYLMLLFLAAALTSSAICDERRTRTLASLMTTPMSATQIVMGKLSSRLVQLFIIGLISVPFLLGVRVFGGLEAAVVVAFMAITITSVFLMASLGILASVWSRKPAPAAALALLMYVLITLGPVFAVFLWVARTRSGPPDEIFAFSSPMAMGVATFAVTGGGGTRIALDELWIVNSVVNICLGLTALFVAGVSLRGVMLSETALEARPKKARRKKRGRRGTPATAGPDAGEPPPPAPEEGAEVFADRDTTVPDDPVMWRERRQPALGSRRIMIVAACLVTALVLWIYTESGPQREQPHMIVTVVGMLMLVIQATIASTPTITSEKDASTWQTLLATPLSAREILIPKLVGSVKKLWFIGAVIGAELFVGMLAGRVHPIIVLHLLMIIIGVGVFLGGTGILFSLVARRTTSAGLFNMLLAGSLWIGIPILGSLVNEFVTSMDNLGSLGDAMLVINPIFMAVVGAEASLKTRYGWHVELPSGANLDLFEYTALLGAVSALGCAIGLAAVWFACRRFNRLAGRSS